MISLNVSSVLSSLAALLLVTSCNQSPRETTAAGKIRDSDDPYSTTVYIGEVNYFSDTEEFYTELYLLPDFEESSDAVVSLVDSVVFENGSAKRTRLPLDQVRKYFMLSGMDSIYVFQTNHTLVVRSPLMRVEYLETNSEKKFIAVYEGQGTTTEPDERYYGISRLLPAYAIAGFKYAVINNPSLNEYLAHRLNLGKEKPVIKNISLQPMGSTYSIVTTRSESVLTEMNDTQFNVLKNMNAKYRIEDIIPLPIEFNGKPLLLTSLYIPGKPRESFTLAVFTDYQEYRFLNYNRLRLKSIGREVHFDHKR